MLNILEKIKQRNGSEKKIGRPNITCYADLIVEYLRLLEIDVVFGIPGNPVEPFLNALARSERNGGPRFITARHECGAVFMAEGYYRETGKIGAVCATTGPGSTNAITGIASAYVDESPILLISGQTPMTTFGKRPLQDSSCSAVDTTGMMKHVTKLSTLVSHPDQLERKLASALLVAHQEPKGPVNLSIPSDILSAPCVAAEEIPKELLTQEYDLISQKPFDQLMEKIKAAKSIAIYVGYGAGSASKKIMELIELTGAPFITSPMGKAWVDETHPLFRGVYGFAGHKSAHNLTQNSDLDLVLAIGANFIDLDLHGWGDDLINKKLVHIDANIEHFSRSPKAGMHICASPHAFADKLLIGIKELKESGKKWRTLASKTELNILGSYAELRGPQQCLSDSSPIKPQRLMQHLSRHLPETTRIYIDAGNAWAWSIHYLVTTNNTGNYRLAMGSGAMSWSIGATIGCALANPGVPTVSIVGDGAYLMSAQEITVAAQLNLPIVYIVLNDAALGMVYHGQKLGKQESIGWQLNDLDYAAMAEAMGIKGIAINTPHDLEKLDFELLFNSEGPCLIDVRIDRDEVPPMSNKTGA